MDTEFDTLELLQEDDADEIDEECLNKIMEELIDEVTLGLCFEVHRACKLGSFLLDDTDQTANKEYTIVEVKGRDIFGTVPMKKQLECVCPNCQNKMAASRFAPHLEKCMGMGRNSSRLASKRIRAKKVSKPADSENESGMDDEDDFDWSYQVDKKAKKMKKDKHANSPRRSKHKSKNGDRDVPSVDSNNSGRSTPYLGPYENMTIGERRELLTHTCGVISEHTKKTCTKSIKCPQHSDEQRRAVRVFILGQQGSSLDADDIQVDIDTYDDADTQSLRDSLQWEAMSNPSPADSNSTTHSTSSKKRKKSSKKKSSKSKSSSSSYSRKDTSTPNSLYEY